MRLSFGASGGVGPPRVRLPSPPLSSDMPFKIIPSPQSRTGKSLRIHPGQTRSVGLPVLQEDPDGRIEFCGPLCWLVKTKKRMSCCEEVAMRLTIKRWGGGGGGGDLWQRAAFLVCAQGRVELWFLSFRAKELLNGGFKNFWFEVLNSVWFDSFKYFFNEHSYHKLGITWFESISKSNLSPSLS